MLLETSMQARFLIPMAISLGFGVLFATGIILLVVPCLYMMREDVEVLVQGVWRRLSGSGPSDGPSGELSGSPAK